jgi:hypothetical protein
MRFPQPSSESLGIGPLEACRRAEYPEWQEPYIYQLPDGNTSLARLLVRWCRALRPAIRWMTSFLARFDYAAPVARNATHPYSARLDPASMCAMR